MTIENTIDTTFSFQAGKPVTGSQLAGREDIIQQIMQLTLNGQSVVLIAPRRFGKYWRQSRQANIFP